MHQMSNTFKSWERGTRFYQALILQDLFDTWIVQKTWGSKKAEEDNLKTAPLTIWMRPYS